MVFDVEYFTLDVSNFTMVQSNTCSVDITLGILVFSALVIWEIILWQHSMTQRFHISGYYFITKNKECNLPDIIGYRHLISYMTYSTLYYKVGFGIRSFYYCVLI